MKLLRNPEVQQFVLLHGILTLLTSTAAFLWRLRYGLFTLGVCMLFLMLHLWSTRRRYRTIAALTSDLDRVLHGEAGVSLNQYAEGELAILQNEIRKMTIRLREQQQSLQ